MTRGDSDFSHAVTRKSFAEHAPRIDAPVAVESLEPRDVPLTIVNCGLFTVVFGPSATRSLAMSSASDLWRVTFILGFFSFLTESPSSANSRIVTQPSKSRLSFGLGPSLRSRVSLCLTS